MLPAAATLCVDQIAVHHLHSSIPDVARSLYSLQLILAFELLGDALIGIHLFYQLQKHIIRLLVQIDKISDPNAPAPRSAKASASLPFVHRERIS